MRLAILAVCLAAGAAPVAAAQAIPDLNYRRTCDRTPEVGMDRKSTQESCMRDEGEARRQLPPVWRKASDGQRRVCLAETTQGGLPSYVELIVCLNNAMAAKQR